MTAFLQLYRLDVCFVTFLTALAGPYFSYGSFGVLDAGIAAFIALIPYNYVYALNAVTDRVEDALNHPERPLPAQRISLRTAQGYVLFLAVASIVGGLFLFRGVALFLALLVVFLGTIYSAPPFRLKDRPLIAAGLTAWGMIHPFFITASPSQLPLGLSFILLAAGVTLFKDIGDTAGDKAAGRRPIGAILPLKALYGLSLLFFVVSVGALLFAESYFVLPVPLFLVAVLGYHLFRYPLEKLSAFIYTRLIRTAVAALCVTGLLIVIDLMERAGT